MVNAEKVLHRIVSWFVIAFSGWTLASHVCVLLGWSLKALVLVAPVLILLLIAAFEALFKVKPASEDGVGGQPLNGVTGHDDHRIYLAALLCLVPMFIFLSWFSFWLVSVLILAASLFLLNQLHQPEFQQSTCNCRNRDALILSLLAIAMVVMSLYVSRNDADDAFYVAVSAYSASHPGNSLLSADPMLGDGSLPLLFPSYRFASFELLPGAFGYLLSVPAMDFYYIYLLPIWVVALICANFLLAKELVSKRWMAAGGMAIIFILILGEMHRSPANFSFFRIYQGKAVFLSVIVPTVFYLTARFFSKRGTSADLLLLGCCQLAAVGLTNFGMLAAPMAGFGAALSNLPLVLRKDRKKLYSALAVLFIPLPYLLSVAFQSTGSSIYDFDNESSEYVWVSVFGAHQQYLIGVLLLAGPILAKDAITRWRLAVPPLLLLAIYLNPWLSGFISQYLTTPPVYWRVTWSFPVLMFAAVSFCMVISELFENKPSRAYFIPLVLLVLGLTVYALPFNTLRPGNNAKTGSFAAWKVSSFSLPVATAAAGMGTPGSLLAPDEIAGVVSRFESHPRLVNARDMYLDLLRPSMDPGEYDMRRALHDFVNGKPQGNDEAVREGLKYFNVSVVVVNVSKETPSFTYFLDSTGYRRNKVMGAYAFWEK